VYLQCGGRSFSDQRRVGDDHARSRRKKQISFFDIGLDALPDNGQVDMHRVRENFRVRGSTFRLSYFHRGLGSAVSFRQRKTLFIPC